MIAKEGFSPVASTRSVMLDRRLTPVSASQMAWT